jgi:hypothetical protein
MATKKDEKAIVEYRKSVSNALAEAEKLDVSSFEGVMDAADVLLRVKTVGEQITEAKETITRPMNESLKATRSLFKPLEDMYAQAERILKDKVLGWHESEWKDGRRPDNKINGLEGQVMVVERFRVEVSDEAAVPREFCVPDMKKVEHALKAGLIVSGASLVPVYDISAGKN